MMDEYVKPCFDATLWFQAVQEHSETAPQDSGQSRVFAALPHVPRLVPRSETRGAHSSFFTPARVVSLPFESWRNQCPLFAYQYAIV